MADDTGDSPFGVAPTAQSIYPADMGATNVDLAREFLGRHNADIAGRQPDIDSTLSRMQLTTDTMTKMLDDTTAAIKASRQGRVSNPLLALGAGLLSSKGNFGEQLGAGITQMIPQIEHNRKEEDDTNLQLAQLALKRGALEQLPLEKKLDYMKALQVGDLSAVRAIEQALIRSKGTGAGADEKAKADAAKLMQKTVQQALEEARKSVAQENTEMYATDADRKQAIRERFIQNIKTHQAAGIPVPDAVVSQVLQTMQTDAGGSGAAQKSFVEDPNNPAVQKRAIEAGLPPPPPTYDPSQLGQKQRTELLKTNAAQFQKESKDWDTESKTNIDLKNDLDRAESLLGTERGKKAVGPQFGGLPNMQMTDLSDEAQKLRGIFTKMQLHGIPKGQGAVSNMERELFASGGPNMGVNAEANLTMIKAMKNVIERDKDRRAFFTDYYNHYRTLDGAVAQWDRYINSDAGQAVKPQGSKIVLNDKRVPYKEYFAQEWGQRKRDGGAIKLDSRYD